MTEVDVRYDAPLKVSPMDTRKINNVMKRASQDVFRAGQDQRIAKQPIQKFPETDEETQLDYGGLRDENRPVETPEKFPSVAS